MNFHHLFLLLVCSLVCLLGVGAASCGSQTSAMQAGTAGSGGGGGGTAGTDAAGATGIGGSAGGCGVASDAGVDAPAPGPATALEDLQRAFIELRFGMFLHFGILTYTGSWAASNLDITKFNPTKLDPNQWADAAVSAGMKFGVLTTRHHDGFALWDSKVSCFDVGSIPWQNGQGDVVRAYVDAFRSHGLLPGLYYSVWDTTEGIGGLNGGAVPAVTPDQLAYVKAQLTELLTNYGPIPLLIFDGWAWKMGHRQVPYGEIRALVKSLQPNCLLLDNSHLTSPWENDLAGVEEAQGNAFVPADNTFPALQMQKINGSGGNDWFWAPDVGSLMSVSTIVDSHLKVVEPRWGNFLLNCPPNRDGLLDDAIVSLLGNVGKAWAPDTTRPPLPAQPPQIDVAYDPVSATATSGAAGNAVDGKDDWYYYSVWESAGALPQSLTVDLGQVRPDVSVLDYVPRYVAQMGEKADGAITMYSVATSSDGTTFSPATSGTWPADGKMKAASFAPVAARYVRLDALAVNGTNAAATEIAIGARR
jgi:alpha-L-fucosidase